MRRPKLSFAELLVGSHLSPSPRSIERAHPSVDLCLDAGVASDGHTHLGIILRPRRREDGLLRPLVRAQITTKPYKNCVAAVVWFPHSRVFPARSWLRGIQLSRPSVTCLAGCISSSSPPAPSRSSANVQLGRNNLKHGGHFYIRAQREYAYISG